MGVNAVVILSVMWDWRSMTTDAGYIEQAPRYYNINPENKSGKMLYKLLGNKGFLVTNACKELVRSANDKGNPDPRWLSDNLYTLMVRHQYRLLLVCGKVAWDTYLDSRKWFQTGPNCRALKMKHPAARDWSKEEIERWQQRLSS